MTRWALASWLGVAGVVLAGCSVIGLTSGAISDATRKPAVLPAWEVDALKTGAPVDVQLRDGRRYVGRFSGLEPRPDAEYAAAYDEARAALQAEVRLPALGPAQLLEPGGKKRAVELAGFGPGCAFVRRKAGKEPVRVPREKITNLTDAAGVAIGPVAIDTRTTSGRLPLRDVFTMNGALVEATAPALSKQNKDANVGQRQDMRLPLEDVAAITWIRPGGNTMKGFLIGAAVDAAVIGVAALAYAADSGGSSSTSYGSGESSCPYVYSWDGGRFVLDAEPFAGSFVEAAQRSDWARLDHLREAGGVYRLRVANELREEEHLDEVKLLVVDHPAGTEIVPDLSGRMHVLSSPVEPQEATDDRGADVRGLLARADGRTWLGNPFGREASDPRQLRDSVVLGFARPARVEAATLALVARSTAWAPVLLHELLALKGRDLDAWYRQVNVDVFGRTLDELTLEAVPTVKVWNGREWALVDLLAALPTATAAAQAFRVDLGSLPAGALRVRIDGLPGTWELDRAAVDFGPPAEPRVTEIDPQLARTAQGEDVRPLLAAVDGRRHPMRTGDTVELRFSAPPAAAGLQRTVVLKATGWYRILVPATGEPQTARFEQLLKEPGALARYSLERIQGGVRPLVDRKLAD